MPTLSIAAVATLAVAVAGPLAAQPATPTQVVDVQSFSFAPQPIHLHANQPVTLTFVNHSGSSHDFSARDFFARARILAGAAPDGEIDLRPHETRSITLVPQAGTYKAHCSHFMHTQLGMQDFIAVD